MASVTCLPPINSLSSPTTPHVLPLHLPPPSRLHDHRLSQRLQSQLQLWRATTRQRRIYISFYFAFGFLTLALLRPAVTRPIPLPLAHATALFQKKYAPPRPINPSAQCSKYSLSPDPRSWGSNLSPDIVEPDDSLHNPENSFNADGTRFAFSARGIANLGCLAMLSTVFLVLL